MKIGISTEEFFERESGGVHHIATILYELGSAVEMATHEWKFDESCEGQELYKRCVELDKFLKRLSITRDTGDLTFYRECDSCGGRKGEVPCEECNDVGAIWQLDDVS